MFPPSPPGPAPQYPALLELVGLEVTEKFSGHLADSVIDAVDTALGRESTFWDRTHSESVRVSEFKHFVSTFIRNASVEMPILLVALVYIRRAKLRLRIESDQWAYERVFLGALIVASKFNIDPRTRNVGWVSATATPGNEALFSGRDLNRMEREFLGVLDWDLRFTPEDILSHRGVVTGLYCGTRQSTVIPSLPPSGTTTPPPMGCAPSGDIGNTRQKPTNGHDLSSPPSISAADNQASLLTEEGEPLLSYPFDSSVFPLSWHNEGRTISKQCTIQ